MTWLSSMTRHPSPSCMRLKLLQQACMFLEKSQDIMEYVLKNQHWTLDYSLEPTWNVW